MKNSTHFLLKTIFFLFSFCLISFNSIYAQIGSIDTNFNVFDKGLYNIGASYHLYDMAFQSDGKRIIVGDYSKYNNVVSNCISRINTDGSIDLSFNTGTGFNLGNLITTVSIDSNSKILVSGEFDNYNGTAKNKLIRLNSNGSVDNTFLIGSGLNAAAKKIIIQPDGKIILLGSFTNFNGSTKNRIVRLNSDGTIDNTFAVGNGFNNTVNDGMLTPDGKLIVVGAFFSYNSKAAYGIVRLFPDGLIDTTFKANVGITEVLTTCTFQSDGKILLGGLFNTFNGSTKYSNFIRVNSDGKIDSTLNTNKGFNGTVTGVKSIDNKIIVIGSFTKFNNIKNLGLLMLNLQGEVDTTFYSFANEYAITKNTFRKVFFRNNRIELVGGIRYFKSDAQNLLILNFQGKLDSNYHKIYGPGSSIIHAISDNKNRILLTGYFVTYNNYLSPRVVRILPNGLVDTTFKSPIDENLSTISIYESAILPDNSIITSGPINQQNTSKSYDLIKFNENGKVDTSFNVILSGFDNITKMLVQKDSKIIIVGDFTSVNGVSRNRIARIDTNGVLDLSFNPAVNFNYIGSIDALVLQPDNKILIGGNFYYNNSKQYGFVRILPDGNSDTLFNAHPLLGNSSRVITSIALADDGKIMIGGQFQKYGSTNAYGLIRINSDGTLDNAFSTVLNSNPNDISISIRKDNKYVITYYDTRFYNYNSNCLIVLNHNGSVDNTFPYNTSPYRSRIKTIITNDNDILVYGNLTQYYTTPRNFIVKLLGSKLPNVLSVSSNKVAICPSETIKLKVHGNLNDGTSWKWYLDTLKSAVYTGDSITFTPNNNSTIYVRGEGPKLGSTTFFKYIINLVDTIKPIIVAPKDTTVYSTLTSNCVQSFNVVSNIIATDNCDQSLQIDVSEPSSYKIGLNYITWKATDDMGNTAMDTQIVNIIDTIAPKYYPKADLNVFANSMNCGAKVTWSQPAFVNSCDVATISSNYSSGDMFPLGTTIVEYIAMDSSGNSSKLAFKVNVQNRLNVKVDSLNSTCFNLNNGSIVLTILDGIPPFLYDWSNDGSGDYDDAKDQSGLSPGTYTVNIMDSIKCHITRTITITEPNIIDTSTIFSANTITANQNNLGYTFQWYNCNADTLIKDSINYTFSPQKNGSYAVIFTNGVCTDTSSCVDILVQSINHKTNLISKIYPNPTSESIFINLNDQNINTINVDLINIHGQILISESLNFPFELKLSEDIKPGIYELSIHKKDENKYESQKVIVIR